MAGKLLGQADGSGVILAEDGCPRLAVLRASKPAQIVAQVDQVTNLTRLNTPANQRIELVRFPGLQERLQGIQRSRCR